MTVLEKPAKKGMIFPTTLKKLWIFSKKFNPPYHAEGHNSYTTTCIWEKFRHTDLCNSSFSLSHKIEQHLKRHNGCKINIWGSVLHVHVLGGKSKAAILFEWSTLASCNRSFSSSHQIERHLEKQHRCKFNSFMTFALKPRESRCLLLITIKISE